VTASAERLNTGQLLTLTLTASYPDEVEIELPDAQAIGGGFTVLEVREYLPTPDTNGRVRGRREWILESGLPGSCAIEPLRVLTKTPDGIESTHMTDALTVEVQSVLPAGGQFPEPRDIASCVPLHSGAGTRVVALMAIGVVALIAFVVIRRTRRTPSVEQTPRSIALGELDQLTQSPSVRAPPVELQRIVSAFLDHHCGLALQSVTPETVLEHLDKAGLPPTTVAVVRSFFVNCDRARFSRPSDAPEETHALIRQCRSLVDACCEHEAEHVL